MDKICIKRAAESRRKRIYDAVYNIKVEESRRALAGLIEYKHHIDHVRLEVQARYKELHNKNEETCPNCRMKQMRIQMHPKQLFGRL